MKNNWKDIWENRVETIEKKSHTDLLIANGYDNERSQLRSDNLTKGQSYYWKLIDLDNNDTVYEIGSGSGAFLYPLYEKGHIVGGIDLSQNLVDLAKENLPFGEWEQGEAISITTETKYDHVVSFGCFLYFPSYEYAEETILKMLEKSNKTVSIYEIPDADYKDHCENMRRETTPNYDTNYEGLKHFYYEKQWFIDFAKKHNLHLTIFDQCIPNYENSKYRFCVVLNPNRR